MKKFQYQHYFRKRNNFSVLPNHIHDKQHNKQYSILHSNAPLYLSEKYLTNHQKIVLAKGYIRKMKREISDRNNSIQKMNNQILRIQRYKTLDSYCDNSKEQNKDNKKYKKSNFQQLNTIILEQQKQLQIRKNDKNFNTIDHCIENNIVQQYKYQIKQKQKQMPTLRKQNSLILSKLKKYIQNKKQADQASGIVVSIIQNQRQSSKSGSNLCMLPAVNIKKNKVKTIQILQVNNVLKCKSLQKSRIIDLQIPQPIENIEIEQQPRHQTQMLPIFKRYKGKYQTKTTKLTHLDRIKLTQSNQQQDHDQTLNFIIKSSSLQKKTKLNSLEQPINMWPFKKQKADFQKQFIQF